MGSSMLGVSRRMQAGIYWPPSPAPFQNPSNPFSPHDQSTMRSIPGTPGTPYVTSILNLGTDDFTGLSPAPLPSTPGLSPAIFPSTPIPSAEHLFDAGPSNTGASISFEDKSLDDMVIEQDPFNFHVWFSYDTNADFLSMGMVPDLMDESRDDHQNLRSEMAPPRRRRYKGEQENDFKKRLYEFESLFGPGHPATLNIHLRLSRVFRHQGRFRAAELSYRQVASTSQKFLGNDHELTFRAVEGLLLTFYQQGRYSIAESHYRSLRRRALKVLGRESDLTHRFSLNMAIILSEMGKLDEAIPLQREVLEIYSKRDGLESLATICAMENLATSLLRLNQLEEAERLIRQAARFHHKVALDDIDITFNKLTLAAIYTRQGRYEESEKMYREVLELSRSLVGLEHPHTIYVMQRLAEVLNMLERHAESKKMNLEILAGRTKVFGPDHPLTLDVQYALVSV
jgi:tetratricopeptide (TPR) repeat protein